MSFLSYFGERSLKNAASAVLIMLSMTACAVEKGDSERPSMEEGSRSFQEVTFAVDAKGNLVLKNVDGKPVGYECSTNPNAENVCPLFKPGHKVQIEKTFNMTVTQYSGSPTCQTYTWVNYATGKISSTTICK